MKQIAFSSPVNVHIATEACDLNCGDVTVPRDKCRATTATRRGSRRAVRLEQTRLNYLTYVVCTVDPAFTARTEPQSPPQPILPSRHQAAYGIPKRQFG